MIVRGLARCAYRAAVSLLVLDTMIGNLGQRASAGSCE